MLSSYVGEVRQGSSRRYELCPIEVKEGLARFLVQTSVRLLHFSREDPLQPKAQRVTVCFAPSLDSGTLDATFGSRQDTLGQYDRSGPLPGIHHALRQAWGEPAYLTKGRHDRAGFCPRARARSLQPGSARGNPSQEGRRNHSHALWCSEHVRARGQKCPTAGAFGSARGPAPLFDHGTTAPGRWRFPDAFVPRQASEGAASAVCIRQDIQKYVHT